MEDNSYVNNVVGVLALHWIPNLVGKIGRI